VVVRHVAITRRAENLRDNAFQRDAASLYQYKDGAAPSATRR
jgi:hypothetical protein